jgi:hypothetical protein
MLILYKVIMGQMPEVMLKKLKTWLFKKFAFGLEANS